MTKKLNARKIYLENRKAQLEARMNDIINEEIPSDGGMNEINDLAAEIEQIEDILESIETAEVE